MINDVHVVIHSEGHQDFFDALPCSLNIMTIKADNTIVKTFHIAKVPTLIVYESTKETKRIYGTIKIRDYLNEKVNHIRPIRK